MKNDTVQPFLSKHIPEANKQEASVANHTYCYRHNPNIKCNEEADQQRLTEIQASIEQLSGNDQKAISNVWSVFSAAPNQQRILILKGLLSQCCFHQLSFLASETRDLIKIDFISALPVEVALKIFCYLDCASLCNAAQVSRTWKRLADDDRVWHHLCKQHIDRKCPNCGWGLPLLYMKRARELPQTEAEANKIKEVKAEEDKSEEDNEVEETNNTEEEKIAVRPSVSKKRKANNAFNLSPKKRTRPWKSVYSERYKVERNWRKALFKIKEFEGHTEGITSLQFDYKILVTASDDRTVKIWDIKTCKELLTLRGHEGSVKAVVFDGKKIVSGSSDCTIKIWNPTTGELIATYRGHTAPVISLDTCNKTLVSGSTDGIIKVWNVETRTCYTLRGHSDWVNSVKIHEASRTIISCSDDLSIRVWSLDSNECIKVFNNANGHIGQVQSALPLSLKDADIVEDSSEDEGERELQDSEVLPVTELPEHELIGAQYPTHVLSCGLDNQIKLWDFKTGKCVRTQFGHIEGVWSVSADTFRIVSGSHDKSVKLWDLQSGKCLYTFGGHHGASVSCVKLSDSRFAAGDDSGVVKMFCFDDMEKDDVFC